MTVVETMDVRWCDVHRRYVEVGETCPGCEGEAHAADYRAAIARMRSEPEDAPSPLVAYGLLAIAACALIIATVGVWG